MMKTKKIYDCNEEGHANDGSCICFKTPKSPPAHTPTPLDVFHYSQEQLKTMWEDSPGTYEMVKRAVDAHEELLKCVKLVRAVGLQKGTSELVRRCDEAIAKAEGR